MTNYKTQTIDQPQMQYDFEVKDKKDSNKYC